MSAFAAASDRVTFREFRQQNEGIDRNAARRMFRQQFGRQQAGQGQLHAVNPFQHVMTVGPNGEIVCGGGSSIDRHTRLFREPRVRNFSTQELSNGTITRVNRGINLDLSSGERNIVLGNGLFGTAGSASVEISVAGRETSFQPGAVVTAAEYVAVKQALDGGQKIEVDRAGRASGGSVDLGSLTSGNTVMRASNLVVPENVTTYGDFAKGSDFRLSGGLSNHGTVQVLSSERSVRGGAIRANDISNYNGALISSTADLHLDAARNLTNNGDILSTGSLTLSAGGQLNNAGRVISNGDLSINASNVTNRGVMSSNSANVNLSSLSDLAVNNHRGVISAVNGAINVRNASYTGPHNSYINGGDLISRELNLNSGEGSSNVAVDQLTGVINGTGTASHVLASTESLNVGNVCLTGDPTFYNVSGAISITGNVIVEEDLVFIAAGAITSNNGVTIQAGDANKGYNITFISGVVATAIDGKNQPMLPPVSGSPPYPNSGTVTISNKATKSGGGITLGTGTVVSSRSTDTANDHDGGNISFFALGKSSKINLGGTKVESGGQKLGKNGDVMIATGATSNIEAASITISEIDTTNQLGGAQGAGGKLTVATAQPVIVNGKTVTYDDEGKLVGSSFFAPSTKISKGDFNLIEGGEINAAGNVEVKSGQILQILGTITAPTANLFADDSMYTNTLTGKVVSNTLTLGTGSGGLIIGAPVTGSIPGLLVNTNSLTINSPGGSVAIQGEGTGVLQLSSSGSTNLSVDSELQQIQGGATATANLLLRAGSLAPTATVSSANNLILVSGDPLVNTDLSQYSAKNLFLSSNSIGTNVNNPFQINPNVKEVDILSLGDAFVNSNSSKGIVLNSVDVFDDFHFTANSGVKVGVDVTSLIESDTGLFNVSTTAGVIELSKNINVKAATGINILNTGIGKKDKISFGTNATLTTENLTGGFGDITIGLGTKGAPLVPTFTNPTRNATNGGTISFFGTGLSAKGAVSSINASKADVIIFNSVGAKNISLGGNNQINAADLSP